MLSARARREDLCRRIADSDVHNRMLAVLVADVAVDGECQFERRCVGTSLDQLRALADWLVAHELEEVFRHQEFDERVSTPSGYCRSVVSC